MNILFLLLLINLSGASAESFELPLIYENIPLEESLKKNILPVVSLKMDREDLFSTTGILYKSPTGRREDGNRFKTGKDWERKAKLKIYKNNKETFKSKVGIRFHGGESRNAHDPSFKFYLRKSYDSKKMKRGFLFQKNPLIFKRAIIHRANDFIALFTKPIAKKLETIVPDFEPSLFYLNQNFMGFYYLSEHLNPKHWKKHLNNPDDFYFVRSKSNYTPDDEEYTGYLEYLNLKNNWILNVSTQNLYAEASELFDLDNFIKHMFSIAFLGTTDWAQGAAIRDGVNKQNPWYFINWDMEHSIIDRVVIAGNDSIDLNREPWEQESFEHILTSVRFHTNKPKKRLRKVRHLEIRRLLFYRLFFESKKFRKDFTSFANRALEELLPQSFLDDLVNKNKNLIKSIGLIEREDSPYKNLSVLSTAENFFKCRRGFVKQRLSEVNRLPYLKWDYKSQNDSFGTYEMIKTLQKPHICK